MHPRALRHLMNIWPPFASSGIQVEKIASDWSYARVALKMRPWNRNYMGTQFGGNLFKMCDPFWAIMAIQRMGPGYLVWDAAGAIDFVAPGRETVYAEFRFDNALRDELVEGASTGKKQLRWFENDIATSDGTVIARARKQLYIRRKPQRKKR